jgi:hypothetical protein
MLAHEACFADVDSDIVISSIRVKGKMQMADRRVAQDEPAKEHFADFSWGLELDWCASPTPGHQPDGHKRVGKRDAKD